MKILTNAILQPKTPSHYHKSFLFLFFLFLHIFGESWNDFTKLIPKSFFAPAYSKAKLTFRRHYH